MPDILATCENWKKIVVENKQKYDFSASGNDQFHYNFQPNSAK
jgi:hypothetical protein